MEPETTTLAKQPKTGNRQPKTKENLTQRAYLNSVTLLLDYGARTVTGFVVTPFLVSGLGSTLFGVWQILGQFTSYTNLADIRATQVLKWAVARDRETVSEDELRRYVTATFLLVMLIMPLLLVAGAVITWFAPVITGVGEEYAAIVRIACGILILSLVVAKVFDIFESILRGMNLGFKRMGVRAGIIVAGGGLKILSILLGYGLIVLATVQVIVALTTGITLYIIVKNNVPWFGFGRVDIKRSKSFLKTSGWFMGWTGTKLLLLNSDKILLGYIAGPVLVTQYVITHYLARSIQGLVTNVVHGVIPGIGKLYGNGEYKKMFKAREHIMLMTWMLAVSIGSIVLAFNKSFTTLWIGEGQFAGQPASFMIILMVAQYLFIQNDSAIISTTLDIKQKVYLGLVAATVSIGISVLLIEDYGIIGLCAGIITGRMILSIGYPWIVNLKTGERMNIDNFPGKIIIFTITIWGAAYWTGTTILITDWWLLLVNLSISLVISIVLAFYLGFNALQRKEIMNYITKIKLFKSN